MTQSVQLTQTILHPKHAASVVTEPVFVWKFYQESSVKSFVDKRSKLKGTFIGEQFVRTGTETQLNPALRRNETRPAAWNGYLLLFVLILVVLIRRLATRKYNQLLFCLSGNTRLNLMLREWNPMKSVLSFVVILVYFTVFSLLIFNAVGFMSAYPDSSSSGLILFFQVFGGLVLLFSLKFFLIRFLSYLFKTHDETLAYLTNHLGFFTSGGLLLLPVVFIMIYNPSVYIVYFGLSIVFILLIIKIVRSFVIGILQPPFSILYLFLYLCALEIMPLMMLTKVFLMLSSGERME